MWTLTICLMLLLGAFTTSIVLLVRFLTRLEVEIAEEFGEAMRAVIEKLIAPVVSPEPIQQIDVPAQAEMFNEPDWSKDWDQTEHS